MNGMISRKSPRDTVSMAGWLFADLLLGLAMLFLVFNTVGEETGLTPTPTFTPTLNSSISETQRPPTLTLTPSPSPSQTITPLPQFRRTPTPTPRVGLDLNPSYLSIFINPDLLISGDQTENNRLNTLIESNFAPYANSRVGLVITLGHHESSLEGNRIARQANEALLETYPNIFSGAVMKHFWYTVDSNHPRGTVVFEFYFYTDSRP